MASKDIERSEKIRNKLRGEGIDSRWTNEAISYMTENGYSINQISTKVAPYIRQKIRIEAKRNAEKDREKQLKLEPVKIKYVELRNRVFSEIIIGLDRRELSIENCSDISKKLLAEKLIKLNRWGPMQLATVMVVTGILYGIIYWISESLRNASDTTHTVTIAVICAVVSLPTALRIVFSPVEIECDHIFNETKFSILDIDSSITKIDNYILKLIEYALGKEKSNFKETLNKIYESTPDGLTFYISETILHSSPPCNGVQK